jgi:hypothetical protein
MSMRSWFCVAAVTIGGGGLFLDRDSSAVTDPDRVLRPARERLVEAWLIGGSSGDSGRRMIGTHQVGSGGWPAFVNERARDVYDWGIRRLWLHNPFGTLPAQVMQFDQFLDAQDAGLNVITENFAEAWAPVVQGSFGEPMELIAYLGTADSADDRLKTAFDGGTSASILGTMLACVKPILLAGGSVGADAAVKLDDDGPEFKFYKYLESIGVPVYVESRPKLENPRWAEFPVFAVDAWWKRSDPAHNPDCVPWALPNEAMQRDVLRWIRDYPGSSTDPAVIADLVARIRAALLEGHTVLFRGDGLRAAGVSIEQIVAGIDEQLGVESGSGGGAGAGDVDAPTDPMDAIEAQSEAFMNPSTIAPVAPSSTTPVGGEDAAQAAAPRSSSGGGGSAGGTAGGSSTGSAGSIEVKPRGSSGGIQIKPGAGSSIQRVGVAAGSETGQIDAIPPRARTVTILRIDSSGKSTILQNATGKPADWIERARRSARRMRIVNGEI